MYPHLVQALMNERVREAQVSAAARRLGRVRGPRILPRTPRPRPAWAARAV
jgi:hypothetical protein